MSLRARLLVAIGVIALVALSVADVVTYKALQSFLYDRIDVQLNSVHTGFDRVVDQGNAVSCLGGSGGPFPAGGPGFGHGSPDGGPSNAFQSLAVQLRSSSGTVSSDLNCPAYVNGQTYSPQITWPIGGLATNSGSDSGSGSGSGDAVYFDAPSTVAGGPTFRVRASTVADGDVLVVALPLGDTVSTLHHLFLVELIVTGGAVVAALLGGFWLVRIGLRPLRDMEAAAESIAEGNLTERVPGENGKTEVGRLARTLNVMLSRIETAFSARVASEQRLRESDARLRRFVADASHELRTPIAAVSAYAELFGRGASEQKADLDRLMRGIVTETGRMEHLVSDLLLLARLDEGRPMEAHSIDLVALCAEAVQTARTVGAAWPVSFHADRPVEVIGDATSLRQVVDNLLGNVRAHTPQGTSTRVSVDTDASGVAITVSDDGPGMTADQVAHVFERFYRSDPSRSRLHGGAGLGLSIVAAIVAVHGGTVQAASDSGVGTTFTVHFPTAPEQLAEPAAVTGTLPA